MKTILEILNLMTDHLKAKGIDHPRRQSEELLCDILRVPRMQLYTDHDRPLSEPELDKCRQALSRRAKGEPVAYISGEVEFHGCQLTVNSSVLIPRQETGVLVDLMIQQLKTMDLHGKTLADVCCGSGCIGLALKKQFPELHVILSDISPAALTVARANAQANELTVEFCEGDLLDPFSKNLDFLVCNPPYISETDFQNLDSEVKSFEPSLALVAKENGFEFYRRLAVGLKEAIKSTAQVWLELGAGQGKGIQELFNQQFNRLGQIKLDWAGHERFFFLEIE